MAVFPEIGTTFNSRRELSRAGVHRDVRRRIDAGAESIILNGLYVDDEDYGSEIIFTGEGGRDNETGRQIRIQTLTRRNDLLAQRIESGLPVRVSRSGHLNSPFAPTSGYRYDGLYVVTRFAEDIGLDGYRIFRYWLSALEGESTAWVADPGVRLGNAVPKRVELSTSRVIRDSRVGRAIKELYDYTCQFCGTVVQTPEGRYAECCHIKPLGIPHRGPDILSNVLCLCPNCHVLFDYHAVHLDDDLVIVETGHKISVHPDHKIDRALVEYHRSLLTYG